jgi:hypothetical protein
MGLVSYSNIRPWDEGSGESVVSALNHQQIAISKGQLAQLKLCRTFFMKSGRWTDSGQLLTAIC